MICPICEKPYTKYRKPMIMPCLHSFCQQCLSSSEKPQCFICEIFGHPILNIRLYELALEKQKGNTFQKNIKVSLIGSTGVGKSCLMNRIIGEGFCKQINSTIGIDFKYIDKQIETKVNRFQIWDTAGQQRYRSVTKNYLRGSDIIVLVYDLQKKANENSLMYWIEEILSVQHKKVIVVGNKLDLFNKSNKFIMKQCLTEEQLTIIAKNQWYFTKISCQNGENIDQLWNLFIQYSKTIQIEKILNQIKVVNKNIKLSRSKCC